MAPGKAVWRRYCWGTNAHARTLLNRTRAVAATARNGRLRNWQSTQAWNVTDCWPRWPAQWWSTHSAHDASADCSSWCRWRDENRSIGTKTANSTHEQRLRFWSSFLIACQCWSCLTGQRYEKKLKHTQAITFLVLHRNGVIPASCRASRRSLK